MKIFSNFDTNLRQKTFQEYQQNYGVENVLCFGRSNLYFLVKCLGPFLLYTVLAIFALMFFYNWMGNSYFWYVITAVAIVYSVAVIPIIGKYLDYKMDFIIVIPNSIMMYDQWGIFKRNTVTISARSIKSITIKKAWLLYSMFDNGDIIILTEWDNEHNGEMVLRRIPRPEKRRNQMVKVIWIDSQADQNPKI